MRKHLLILAFTPALVLAKPTMQVPSCGDMPPPKFFTPPLNKEHLPEFIRQIDLSDQQQLELKALFIANRANFDAYLADAKKIEMEIRSLSFSNAYSDEKIQTLSDQAAAIHQRIALHKSKLDNTIFKLLNAEQQKKLQSSLTHFEDCFL